MPVPWLLACLPCFIILAPRSLSVRKRRVARRAHTNAADNPNRIAAANDKLKSIIAHIRMGRCSCGPSPCSAGQG